MSILPQKNIGKTDRLLRFAIGMALLVLAWLAESWILLGFSLFVFFEVFFSWCILYQLMGKNSCPIKSGKDDYRE